MPHYARWVFEDKSVTSQNEKIKDEMGNLPGSEEEMQAIKEKFKGEGRARVSNRDRDRVKSKSNGTKDSNSGYKAYSALVTP